MPFNEKKYYRKSYYGYNRNNYYNRYERSESRERSEPRERSEQIANQPSAASYRERSEQIANPSSRIANPPVSAASYRERSEQPIAYPSSLIANRLPLASLMPEEAKSSANIQSLTYDFASRCIRLYQYLNDESQYKEYVMSKQLLRSGTSIGANVRESQHAQSDADFLSKMSIALKEADETSYWIHLLHDNGYISNEAFTSLETDIQRILRLLTSITKTLKNKLSNK